ncbi:AidA/PixA family protein [Candidatus Electronema sp. JM]|uniref:AidA/PixA family protein n=1 Tax=Candidatus Electronema sp. JM TaxID=3401571 RepID=UPI003AA816DB
MICQFNALVIIDTEKIIAAYLEPVQDVKNPPVIIDPSFAFILCPSATSNISTEQIDLYLNADGGDNLSFRCTSFFGNSNNSVFFYDDYIENNNQIFGKFILNINTLSRAIQPDPKQQDGLPPIHVCATFSNIESKVLRKGSEQVDLMFSLYQLDDDGQSQSLYGYFGLKLQLTVS